MNTIIAPVISEKSMADAAKNKFTFRVARAAGKDEIKKEIEKKFKVNVIGISTITIKGRTQKTGTRRIEVKHSPFKKAVVKLKEGQKIALFDIGA